MNVAVDIIPAIIFADETAGFMQACGTAADAAAGGEFDDGVGFILLFVPDDVQANPFWRGTFLQVEMCGATRRMPALQQIAGIAERKGGVTAAHQRFGTGRVALAGEQRQAAIRAGMAGAARTERRGVFFLHTRLQRSGIAVIAISLARTLRKLLSNFRSGKNQGRENPALAVLRLMLCYVRTGGLCHDGRWLRRQPAVPAISVPIAAASGPDNAEILR